MDATVPFDASTSSPDAGSAPDSAPLPPLDGGCEPNPNLSNTDCPVRCPETCNGVDDDCDGRSDEQASSDCSLDQAEAVCVAGRCGITECSAGFRDCDGDPKNGCEVPPDDVNHCGACGQGCDLENAVAGCVQGSCVAAGCLDNFDSCDQSALTGCETPVDRIQHCGDCTSECAPAAAVPTCGDGQCSVARCLPGHADCNGDTTDGCETPLDTLADCAGCATACAKTSCVGGICTDADCTAPMADCDGDGSSCETDVGSDSANCGACGAPCAFAASVDSPHASLDGCVDGSCSISCEVGWGDCDGDYANGCESALNTRLDCGACGEVCAVPGAVPSCATGTCQIASCIANYADCDGDGQSCEAYLRSLEHCGGCGRSCKLPNAVTGCESGSCELLACEGSFVDCNGEPEDGCELDVAAPDQCDCGVPNTDSDGDGTADCKDLCPRVAATASACFPYQPRNFDPELVDWLAAPDAVLDCGTTTIDTSGAVTLTNFCGPAPTPTPIIVAQPGGGEVVVIALTSLQVAAGATVRVIGSRPLIFAVADAASIAGTIDASADGTTHGAGGNIDCGSAAGTDVPSRCGNETGGGGGGGFGTSGGRGGAGDDCGGGLGGGTRGTAELVPLMGGCRGGTGGGCTGRGGAGGALQISAGSSLLVTGSLRVHGGDGPASCGGQLGGAGGGSGGGLLLEAESIDLTSAVLDARGGNGGNGSSRTTSGGIGSTDPELPGKTGQSDTAAGGAGGGGGYGRIAIDAKETCTGCL